MTFFSYSLAKDDSAEIPVSSGNLLAEILDSNDFTDVEKQLLKYIIFNDVKDFVQRKTRGEELEPEDNKMSDAFFDNVGKRSHLWAYRAKNIPIQTRVAFGRPLMRTNGGHGSNGNILRYGRK